MPKLNYNIGYNIGSKIGNNIESNMLKMFDKFIIYTDGACINNGRKNAKCSIGIHFSNKNKYKINDVSEILKVPTSTNNIAELTAIKTSLELVKAHNIDTPIYLYSDSEYSLNVLEKWYPTWTDTQKKTKKNIPLIDKTYKLYKELNPTMTHVRSHTGNTDEHSLGNDKADKLATGALKKFENKTEDISKYFQ